MKLFLRDIYFQMVVREATIADYSEIHGIRLLVKENVLINHHKVTYEMYDEYLSHRGKGWLAEIDNRIVGFAIVDLKDNNIWALFIRPDFEKRGIGRQLHDVMMSWCFSKTRNHFWLSTDPKTRAEKFYRKAGWIEKEKKENEIFFEMSYQDWIN